MQPMSTSLIASSAPEVSLSSSETDKPRSQEVSDASLTSDSESDSDLWTPEEDTSSDPLTNSADISDENDANDNNAQNRQVSPSSAPNGQNSAALDGSMSDKDADANCLDDPSSNILPIKRKYSYRNRSCGSKSNSPVRKKKWASDHEGMVEHKMRRTFCCTRLKCMSKVNYQFAMEESQRLISASRQVRRNVLRSYMGSDRKFYFDGNRVCVEFLRKVFHFSSGLISEVSKKESGEDDTPSSTNTASKTVRSINTGRSNQVSSSDSSKEMTRKKKESIVSLLFRLAEDCGDHMPDRMEVHLPFHQKKEVFPVFLTEFKRLYPICEPPTPQYFRRIWKRHCPQHKVMKNQRFSTCDECDCIRRGIKEAILNGHSTTDLKLRRKQHLDFIFRERMEYQVKRDRARLRASEYMSLIVDGADQSAFGLPHFTTKPKSQRGHSMKVKLIGLLEHRIKNKLSLFTMTEEHATGANHVVEVVHRFINAKRNEGPLPPKLYVQLDNCGRENKNKFLLSYLEMLVSVGCFVSVEVGFLPVGHTHEDIDQAFSQTSARLRVHNAVTLTDLHEQLSKTNQGNVEVQHMQRIVNWSGLCEAENCIRKIDRVSQWRYFLFTRDPTCTNNVRSCPLFTKCFVKTNSIDSWKDLFTSGIGKNPNGMLRHCPDLGKTPPLKIECPDGVDNITKRFESEEGRVNDSDKMITLYELRDFVFAARVDSFHWDLTKTVETEYCGLYPSRILSSEDTGEQDEYRISAAPRIPSEDNRSVSNVHVPRPSLDTQETITPSPPRHTIAQHRPEAQKQSELFSWVICVSTTRRGILFFEPKHLGCSGRRSHERQRKQLRPKAEDTLV